jgi:predicted MFS family arabinose efflux permease
MGSTMAGRRGPVLGILAFLAYGSLLGVGALSSSRLRRWSAEHIVLDSLIVVPLAFFALLLIPMLPWWGAALIALATGAIFVPFAARRRTAQQRLARGY